MIYDHEAYEQGRRHERSFQEAKIDCQIIASSNVPGMKEYQEGRRSWPFSGLNEITADALRMEQAKELPPDAYDDEAAEEEGVTEDER